MAVNVELMKQVMAKIDSLPELPDELGQDETLPPGEYWDQADWSMTWDCGTAKCFAGWAVALEYGNDYDPRLNGESYSAAAARLLGLSEWALTLLFSPSNSLEDLHKLVEAFLS